MSKRLRAISNRVIVAQVQVSDHKVIQNHTGQDIKLHFGREKAEPLGVVISVGPECGKGGAALRGVVECLTDTPNEYEYYTALEMLIEASKTHDLQPGNVIVYRRSDTVASTGGMEDWDCGNGARFNLEVISEDEVWGVVEEVERLVTSDGVERTGSEIVGVVG